jgi:hypothetical protein
VQRRISIHTNRIETDADQISQAVGVGVVDNDTAKSVEGAGRRQFYQNCVGAPHPVVSCAERDGVISHDVLYMYIESMFLWVVEAQAVAKVDSYSYSYACNR